MLAAHLVYFSKAKDCDAALFDDRPPNQIISRNGTWLFERGRRGGRRDSNPQQPEPQSGALPLSYGHHRWREG